jgi:hypothetical protein
MTDVEKNTIRSVFNKIKKECKTNTDYLGNLIDTIIIELMEFSFID